jgi:hypothetical protein
MKNIFYSLITSLILVLSGCSESVQEITINADGTGTVTNTNDMSALMGLAKQMAGKDIDKIGKEKIDTGFSLASRADSVPGLTEGEKAILKTGYLQVNMDVNTDKLLTQMKFPFTNASEIAVMNKLSTKIMQEAIAQQMGENPAMGGMAEGMQVTSFDDYFQTEFKDGLIVRTINKEKYAKAADDKYLNGMKEAAAMGLPMSSTYIINLPRPAKKVEGKGLKLSDDKKKVTVKADVDDFFSEPALLEYRIEY